MEKDVAQAVIFHADSIIGSPSRQIKIIFDFS